MATVYVCNTPVQLFYKLQIDVTALIINQSD